MLASISSILLVVLLFAFEYVVSLKECNDYQECKDQSIIDDGITCSATESCKNAPLIKSTNFIKCTSWKSCSNANIRAAGNIHCTSGSSCGGINGGSIRGRVLCCGGANSCDYFQDGQKVIAKTLAYCSAASSCYNNTEFTIGKRIDCNGIYSCRYSQIELGL